MTSPFLRQCFIQGKPFIVNINLFGESKEINHGINSSYARKIEVLRTKALIGMALRRIG
jgi:hypothetical protein